MSAVSLQRPIFRHHLHIPSQLQQLAVSSPLCRTKSAPRCCSLRSSTSSSRSSGAARGNYSGGAGGVRSFRTAKRSLLWGQEGRLALGLAARRRFPAGKGFSQLGSHVRFPWVCTFEAEAEAAAAGIRNYATRRSLRKTPSVVEKDEQEENKDQAAVNMEGRATGKKRPSLQPKQLALRPSGVHGNTFISYVQILGTGMDTGDTSPSVLLFFDKRRIIFNAGELDHVFLTRVCSETGSGLPGLLLTLSNTGEAGMAVNLWGPSNLNFLVDAMRTFIPNSSVVHTHSFGEGESQKSPTGSLPVDGKPRSPKGGGDTVVLLEDEVVRISAIFLHPGPPDGSPSSAVKTHPKRQEAEAPPSPETNDGDKKLARSRNSRGSSPSAQQREDSSLSFTEPWELGFDDKETTSDVNNQSLKRSRMEPSSSPSVLSDPHPVVDVGLKLDPKSPPTVMKDVVGIPDGGTEGPVQTAVVYICELPEIIGRFDPKKAQALGLRPGPKYGQLQAGQSVLADDGEKTIHPSDVMDPPSPGPICIVVDCPTVSYIPSLLSAPGLQGFNPTAFAGGSDKAKIKKVTCIIHIGPASVVKCPEYREWMDQFEGTQHLMAGHGMLSKVSPILKSSARIMTRLNYICPQVFPILGLQQVQDEMETSPDYPTGAQSITIAENLLKFRLRPLSATPLDRSSIPVRLDIAEVQAELVAENVELPESYRELAKLWDQTPARPVSCFAPPAADSTDKSSQVEASCMEANVLTSSSRSPMEEDGKSHGSSPRSRKAVTGKEDLSSADQDDTAGFQDELPGSLQDVTRQEMEMVFLGTGSSQPSRYRNVSAIYIHLFKRGGLLLDCGEGTYAQLKRRYGNAAADEVVAGLKCVWISHIHADHHTGLTRILSVRKKLLEAEGRMEPVLVIGPKQLKRYLDAYELLEDLGMTFLDCSQTTAFAASTANEIRKGSSGYTTEAKESPNGNDINKSRGDVLKATGGLISLPLPGKRPNHHVTVDGEQQRGRSSQLQNYWLQSGFNFQAGLDEQGLEKLKVTLSSLGLAELTSVPVVHCPHAFGVVLVARGRKLLQPGWKLVYSGDTRPCQALVEASESATVLIHEATFDDTMPEEARAKLHSLTREAIETGIAAGAYRTILTHFSQRYPKIPVFNESYNDRTCIAFDMMSVNLADLPLLPKLLPALKLLFKDDLLVADEGGEGGDDGADAS